MKTDAQPMTTLPGSLGGPASVEANTRRGGWASWFRRREPNAGQPAGIVERRQGLDLHREFEDMVVDCFNRFGLSSEVLKAEAVLLGHAGEREVYVVLVTVLKDDAQAALQLTFGASMIEKRVGDLVRSRWISDYTYFAGVWTHWPADVRLPPEVRQLLHTVRSARASSSLAAAKTQAASTTETAITA